MYNMSTEEINMSNVDTILNQNGWTIEDAATDLSAMCTVYRIRHVDGEVRNMTAKELLKFSNVIAGK